MLAKTVYGAGFNKFSLSVMGAFPRQRRSPMNNVERLCQRAKLQELFEDSRRSAGSRTLVLRKVRSLMRESSLVSRQPRHLYKQTGQARVGIPNLLDRQLDVTTPNKMLCGDITYLWTDGSAVVWRLLLACALAESSNGPCQKSLTFNSLLRH